LGKDTAGRDRIVLAPPKNLSVNSKLSVRAAQSAASERADDGQAT
jgi:hypothetical protein